jgi:hypothetical protein
VSGHSSAGKKEREMQPSHETAGRMNRLSLVLSIALIASACASSTPIGRLLAEPGRYDGQEVRVEGTVTRSAGLLGMGAFEVEDGTGSIVVVAQSGGVPAEGARTRVKGTFQSVFSLMGRTIAAILQTESDR